MTELEQQQRAAVIAEAWTWVGTPFRHQSDVKGAGADCAMWLLRAFAQCGVVEFIDPRPYARLWFLHKSEEVYLGWLNRFGAEIAADEAQPGDVVIFKYGLCYSHAGLIIDDQRLIHAWFKEDRITPCERFTVELTHYGREVPRLCGQPRPVKYFNAWKKRAELLAASS